MKKIIPLLGLLFLIVANLNAQNNGPGFEKYMQRFKTERIAFITEKLEFSVEEAKDFWPLYNDYQDKRGELLKSKRMSNHGRGKREELNSKELEAMVDSRVEKEVKLAELKLEFHKKVKEVIPIEKVARLYRAENEFMNYMLKKIDEQRSQHRRNSSREEK